MIYFSFHAWYIFSFRFSSASVEWIIQLLKGMKNKWDGFQNVINHVKFFIRAALFLFVWYLFNQKEMYMLQSLSIRLSSFSFLDETRRKTPPSARNVNAPRHSFESCSRS